MMDLTKHAHITSSIKFVY